jgi:hypothetical protein
MDNNLICFQVYSLTRVATLATVALNMFNVDATSQIYCQVCHAIRLCPYARFLIAWFFKVTADLQFVRNLTHQIVRQRSS